MELDGVVEELVILLLDCLIGVEEVEVEEEEVELEGLVELL